MTDPAAAVERVFREEYGRLIATLVRRFGDIDLAEEMAAEALVVALERWPADGVPPNPGGWLTTTAARRGDRPHPPREAARCQAPGGTDDPASARRHGVRAA